MKSGEVDGRGLLVASGDAAPLFEAVDAPVDGVALLVCLAVEGWRVLFYLMPPLGWPALSVLVAVAGLWMTALTASRLTAAVFPPGFRTPRSPNSMAPPAQCGATGMHGLDFDHYVPLAGSWDSK